MNCEYCGVNNKSNVPKYREEYGKKLCWKCYTHFKEHPVNKLPNKGVVELDEQGRVICHICGRAYDRLAAHLIHKHNTNLDDYKKEFGLNRTQRLTSERHRNKIIKSCSATLDNVEKYRNVEINNCKGEKHPRYGKKNRLQAKINRINKKNEMELLRIKSLTR